MIRVYTVANYYLLLNESYILLFKQQKLRKYRRRPIFGTRPQMRNAKAGGAVRFLHVPTVQYRYKSHRDLYL